MREIKFRAWDTRYNLFQKYDDEYISLEDGKCYEVTSYYDNLEKEELPYILSQYTGLKDKNDKEIYEGDIVKGVNRLHECEVEQNVHFLKGCFMFGNWNAHEFFNKHQSIEVIGNIYENPELLEGKE